MLGCIIAGFSKNNLNLKEKLFIAISLSPKGVTQAALAAVILNRAKSEEIEDYIIFGEQILTVVVLEILITAPMASFAAINLAPYLLEKNIDATKAEPLKL